MSATIERIRLYAKQLKLPTVAHASPVSYRSSHFQAISERAERASLIISTNLEFSKWVQFLKDPMLTAALVDRVTQRAHILNMNGKSYRLKESRARNANVKVDQT